MHLAREDEEKLNKKCFCGCKTMICRRCEIVFYEHEKHECEGVNPPNITTNALGQRLASDPVNRPAHYTHGGIETIDYLKAKMSPEMFEGFLLGNVLKYTSRYREKNGRQDLEKARWYLNKLLEGETE